MVRVDGDLDPADRIAPTVGLLLYIAGGAWPP
jgi:hypothetical protein